MIVGAVIMAELYSTMKPAAGGWGNLGQVTLPQVLGVNHWVVIAVFVILCLSFFRWVERKGL